jgi:hypothetical protein
MPPHTSSGAWVARLTTSPCHVLGCKPELPSLDYRGERVRVGSDVVDQICAGTLSRIDREVEQIETRLDLPIQDSAIDVYVLDPDTVDIYCSGANCTPMPSRRAPFVVVNHLLFERAIAHELVHARLAGRSAPLYEEGIAQAVAPPRCPQSAPDVELAAILAAKKSLEWPEKWGTYYVAGELFAWLLEQFGPHAVLSLLQSVPKGSSSATIRAEYLEHFDRELEADIFAHLRTQADLDALAPERFGCLAAPIDSSKGPVELVADLDCDSDRVHNNFGIEGSGYVEWTLALDHAQTLELVGELPAGTGLTIEDCACVPVNDKDEYRLARPFDGVETLQPGSYRLRWIGALDEGLALDVELVPLQG